MTDFKPNVTKSIDNLNKLQEDVENLNNLQEDVETTIADLQEQVDDLEEQIEENEELINALLLVDLTNITPTIDVNNHTYEYQLTVTTELEHMNSKITIFGEVTTESFMYVKVPYLIKLNGLKGIYFNDYMCDAETAIIYNTLGFFVDFQLDNRSFHSGQIETVWDTTEDTKSFKITFNYI